MDINDLFNQINELSQSLGGRLNQLEQTFRRHKHLGQAYDLSELLDAASDGGNGGGSGGGNGGGTTTVDLFAKFIDLTHWNSLDAFNVTVGSFGAVNPRDSQLQVAVSSLAGSVTDSGIVSKESYINLFEVGLPVTAEWQLAFVAGGDIGFTGRLFLTTDPSVPTNQLQQHVGFQLQGTGQPSLEGDIEIFASCADGNGTQNLVTTGITMQTNIFRRTRLKLIYTPPTKCEYYVDGVLKVTSTVKLPTAKHVVHQIGLSSRLQAMSRTMLLNRFLLTKEY